MGTYVVQTEMKERADIAVMQQQATAEARNDNAEKNHCIGSCLVCAQSGPVSYGAFYQARHLKPLRARSGN